jgi:hypothetical protein
MFRLRFLPKFFIFTERYISIILIIIIILLILINRKINTTIFLITKKILGLPNVTK